MKNKKPNAELVWKQLEDVLVARLGLNFTERAVYAHLLRHSRLEGKRLLRFSIVWLARSVRLSDRPARHAVRSLAAKGALRLVDRSQAGHLVEVLLPDEVPAAPHEGTAPSCLARRPSSRNLEELDFLQVSSRREAIHARERGQCFYCLRRFVARGRVLDHVVPRARGGSNSYRNLVSCCVECNTRKGETVAEDFLRTLYRLRRLTSAELDARLRALEALAAGELRPVLAPPAVVITEQRSRSPS
jgi:5-methylcytosine-specific restriction endonuclease McrA